MPYVNCPRCGLRAYSAARWSHIDRCPNCDEVLAQRPAKRLTMPFDALEVEDRVRERLYGGPRSVSVDAVPRGRGGVSRALSTPATPQAEGGPT